MSRVTMHHEQIGKRLIASLSGFMDQMLLQSLILAMRFTPGWWAAEQATNEHWTDNNGTVFLVSSDIFTFSGLLNSADGVPALRSWAITHTDRIAEVGAPATPPVPGACSQAPATAIASANATHCVNVPLDACPNAKLSQPAAGSGASKPASCSHEPRLTDAEHMPPLPTTA